jgi:uncharacterized protein (UPF0212 family)
MEPDTQPSQSDGPDDAPLDLEACPRCGEKIDRIIWGQTNCPNCGLHFECC